MPEKSHVALTRCFYCMEPDKILLAKRYNHKGEPVHDLSPAQDKVIDMDPCNKCQDWMKQGIILIGIYEAKSDPDWNTPPKPSSITGKRDPRDKNWMPNPYRSGAFSVIKEEAFKRLVEVPEIQEFALKHRWMFIEHEVMVMTGIVPEKEEEEPRVCPGCKSKGFPVSTLSDERCTFCDGTEGGHEPSVTTALEDQKKEEEDGKDP